MQSWCHIDTETLFQELLISATELKEMSQYYFDGKGKAFRPIIVVLMARACNTHYNNSRWVLYFPSSVGLYSACLPSLCYRVVSCLRSSMYLRIHFVMNRFWLWVAKVTLESGLGTFLYPLFYVHGRTTSATNKHFRKEFQSQMSFSHSEVKTSRLYAYIRIVIHTGHLVQRLMIIKW